jgi:tripartite-type tricarboxylate transporter receptor subunit TctC
MQLIHRVVVFASVLAAAALPAASCQAQAFPTKPIVIVVPFAPGGSTDLTARQLATEMQAYSPQPVIIENRPGASGLVGADYVGKNGGDGHVVCFCSPSVLFQAITNPSVSIDPTKFLAPVIHLFDIAAIIITRADLPVKNLAELIALAKKEQGGLTYGSSGTTSKKAPYPIELLKDMTGNWPFTIISYKAGESAVVTDMLARRIDFGYASVPAALQHIEAGKLKAIAVVAPARLSGLPNVPTLTEAVPGYEASIFFGLFVSMNAPRVAVERIHDFAASALKSPAFQERLRANALYPVGGTQEAFAARVRADEARYTKLMKE